MLMINPCAILYLVIIAMLNSNPQGKSVRICYNCTFKKFGPFLSLIYHNFDCRSSGTLHFVYPFWVTQPRFRLFGNMAHKYSSITNVTLAGGRANYNWQWGHSGRPLGLRAYSISREECREEGWTFLRRGRKMDVFFIIFVSEKYVILRFAWGRMKKSLMMESIPSSYLTNSANFSHISKTLS